MFNFDLEQLLECSLYALYTGITELQYLLGIGQNNVVVLLVLIGALIMRSGLTELMLAHETAVNQQFHGIVERSS